ncbi:hypothetical protein BpHYR1_047049 [Brachionus plicatilis]|uniref:Uncharacterized protein n=1 Tax=Brachionus plicatilis TaxID=10195 RepID=A0A3M7RY41_BRAPC|nr:hypothetical protein BpHYR1_047049 [Brachionus plicatilis]
MIALNRTDERHLGKKIKLFNFKKSKEGETYSINSIGFKFLSKTKINKIVFKRVKTELVKNQSLKSESGEEKAATITSLNGKERQSVIQDHSHKNFFPFQKNNKIIILYLKLF